MKHLGLFASLSLLVAGALPAAAQHAQEGANPAMVEHAELGTLEAVGAQTNRVIIALPGDDAAAQRVYESYDTNEQTLVQGLGSLMRVNSTLGPYVGNVVVVTYVDHGQHYFAKRLDFSPDRTIRETRGTIRSIDPSARSIVIRNAQGADERMLLGSGPGAAIDSDRGLLTLSDLRVGQNVTVYFGHAGVAYLVRVG